MGGSASSSGSPERAPKLASPKKLAVVAEKASKLGTGLTPLKTISHPISSTGAKGVTFRPELSIVPNSPSLTASALASPAPIVASPTSLDVSSLKAATKVPSSLQALLDEDDDDEIPLTSDEDDDENSDGKKENVSIMEEDTIVTYSRRTPKKSSVPSLISGGTIVDDDEEDESLTERRRRESLARLGVIFCSSLFLLTECLSCTFVL